MLKVKFTVNRRTARCTLFTLFHPYSFITSLFTERKITCSPHRIHSLHHCRLRSLSRFATDFSPDAVEENKLYTRIYMYTYTKLYLLSRNNKSRQPRYAIESKLKLRVRCGSVFIMSRFCVYLLSRSSISRCI